MQASFKLTSQCRCSIVYDMNTPTESYEWFDMSISREDEFKLLRDRINIIEHAPRGQPQGPRTGAEGNRPGVHASSLMSRLVKCRWPGH